VLEAVFILLEFPSPSRRIFIGSHSLPPTSLVRRIGPAPTRLTTSLCDRTLPLCVHPSHYVGTAQPYAGQAHISPRYCAANSSPLPEVNPSNRHGGTIKQCTDDDQAHAPDDTASPSTSALCDDHRCCAAISIPVHSGDTLYGQDNTTPAPAPPTSSIPAVTRPSNEHGHTLDRYG
jgi:hypothetical protein